MADGLLAEAWDFFWKNRKRCVEFLENTVWIRKSLPSLRINARDNKFTDGGKGRVGLGRWREINKKKSSANFVKN